MAKLNKIDSNSTGLRYARNSSLGVLPVAASQVWLPLEPNSYTDFGGQITTIARRPINPSRQAKKGVVTDVSANIGFNIDLTQRNLQDLMEGYWFARYHRKDETLYNGITIASVSASTDDWILNNIEINTLALNAAGSGYSVNDVITLAGGTFQTAGQVTVNTVDGMGGITGFTLTRRGVYSVSTASFTQGSVAPSGGTGATFNMGTFQAIHTFNQFVSSALVFVRGLVDDANNGLHKLNANFASNTTISTADELVDDASPATDATIVVVGYEFASDDAKIDASGTLPKLTTEAMGTDLTTLGLSVGEWIFIGGDGAAESFAVTNDNGFARIRSIAAHAIEFDKTAETMTTNAGSSKTIRIFFGRFLRNEQGTSIVRTTNDFERILGANDDSDLTKQQAEYVVGGVNNEATFNFKTADKATVDLTFIGLRTDHIDENVDGANTILSKAAVVAGSSANAPAIEEADGFNTSSDVTRIKMSLTSNSDANVTPLFAYVTDLTFTVKNNLDPNKAIGVLGAFEVTAGLFEVGGSVTAYFSDVAAVEAVQNNEDITIDAHFVKQNAGVSFDLPLLSLGNGKPDVAIDKAITLPLDLLAASGAKVFSGLDYTASLTFWDYLPDLAE